MGGTSPGQHTMVTHRRQACLVALCFLAVYSMLDMARSVGWHGHLARAVWVLAVALGAAAQHPGSPRLADAAGRLVGVVSGVAASVLVHAYGGAGSLYFGFLLGVPFCILVLVPDLPSSAALAGLGTTVGGVVILALDGRPRALWLEWVALSAVMNTLALWATVLYGRIRRSERAAELARADAEWDLRASEERFRAAFSSTSLGAMILDPRDGRILEANTAVEQKLGHGSLVGVRYEDLVMPGEGAEVIANLRALMAGGHVPRLERRYRTKRGEVLLGAVHASPVHDREGNVTSAIIVIDDITERRTMRERLEKAERLAALGTLAAGVAHEINNPLAYVKANLCWAREVVHEGSVTHEELGRVIEETEKGAERIARIVSELSVYARGREEPEAADVQPIVEEALRMASPKLGCSHVSLELARDLPAVSVVGRHLAQALLNLLANAADAVESRARHEPRAARDIVVAAWREGNHVVVAVEDSGTGMTEEVRAHLFEPFFTTKGPLGTGLGLAISRENLSRFGATIDVCHGELGGARFCVRLPIAFAASVSEPRNAA